MTILAACSPYFLPVIGFFHRMACVDVFVLMDTARVPVGRSYASRTRIKDRDGDGWRWLSLPVHRSQFHTYQQARVAEGILDNLWGVVEHNYRHAPHFYHYAGKLRALLGVFTGQPLAVANEALIRWLRMDIGVLTKMVRQSELGIEAPKEQLPIELCQALGADVYLSGTGAREYNEPERFETAGIELRYQEFTCPQYAQVGDGPFVPNLSAVDLLFNLGPQAGRMLHG
jgi:hypothetical protein